MATMQRYTKPMAAPQREEVKWDEDPVIDQLKKINFNTFKIKQLLETHFAQHHAKGGVNDEFLEEETR